MRSCTAETIFKMEGFDAKSAGTSKSATITLTNELICWADLIFVMEEKHRVIITTYHSDVTENKKIIVLNIPDNYYYMERKLVELIKERVRPHLI